jgi:hypothetical protein
MRRIVTAVLLLFVPLVAFAAVPVVNSGTINYQTNQITLTGTGFEPAKTKPTVQFNGTTLAVVSFSNTQVVATLPAAVTPGTFNLTVTNSQGNGVDFNMTYGPTGPQGPAGPAGAAGAQGPAGPAGATGATGAQGPRGLTGAPGAPGPAGANGTSFIFLDTYNPYATYAANNVVTYNGSSYIAILPNGPNPSGPTPDQNPSWGLMAAGGTGPAGPAGPQGPAGPPGSTGLMGNPGSTGPAGPQGPAGPAGGVLSYATSAPAGSMNITRDDDVGEAQVATLTLPNAGTYIVSGQATFSITDLSGNLVKTTQYGCLFHNFDNPSLQTAGNTQNFTYGGTVTVQGFLTVGKAGESLDLYCFYVGTGALNNPTATYVNSVSSPVITAIQVQ